MPEGVKQPGDWGCAACGANVFGRKQRCFKCKSPRVAVASPAAGGVSKKAQWLARQAVAGPPPPCTTLFIGNLQVCSEGKKLRQRLVAAFQPYAAPAPRVRIARNSCDHTVGYGWVERIAETHVDDALATLDGAIEVEFPATGGGPAARRFLSVSRCCSTDAATAIERDILCPKLPYHQRQSLDLAHAGPKRVLLETPTAERIAAVLREVAYVGGSVAEGDGRISLLRQLTVLDVHAGIGTAAAVFAEAGFGKVIAQEVDPVYFSALSANQPLFFAVPPAATVHLHRGSNSGAPGKLDLTAPSVAFAAMSMIAFVYPDPSDVSESSLAEMIGHLLFGHGHGGGAQGECEHGESSVVAALVPSHIDFDSVAAALVGGGDTTGQERCHPFSVEFPRPAPSAVPPEQNEILPVRGCVLTEPELRATAPVR